MKAQLSRPTRRNLALLKVSVYKFKQQAFPRNVGLYSYTLYRVMDESSAFLDCARKDIKVLSPRHESLYLHIPCRVMDESSAFLDCARNTTLLSQTRRNKCFPFCIEQNTLREHRAIPNPLQASLIIALAKDIRTIKCLVRETRDCSSIKLTA